jgi:hydrogenase maturation protease
LNEGHLRPETTLILGVGNIILGDEGFGVHVARRLKDMELPGNVRVEEGGVGGFNLLGLLEGVKQVIVIDAMMIDLPPGEVLFFKPGANFNEAGKRIISFHQIGVPELVQMMGLIDYRAEVFFLVTRPQRIEWSTGLSPAVQLAVTKAVNMIKELSKDNFARLERGVLCT